MTKLKKHITDRYSDDLRERPIKLYAAFNGVAFGLIGIGLAVASLDPAMAEAIQNGVAFGLIGICLALASLDPAIAEAIQNEIGPEYLTEENMGLFTGFAITILPIFGAAFGALHGALRQVLMRPVYNAFQDIFFKNGEVSDHPIKDRYADDLKNNPIKTNLYIAALYGLFIVAPVALFLALGSGLSPEGLAACSAYLGVNAGLGLLGGLFAGALYKFIGRPVYNTIRGPGKNNHNMVAQPA